MSLRKTLFWLHLAAGLTAGLVIALMAFTGLCMAYRPQLLAWSDHTVARVAPPADLSTPLPLADLLARLREDWPDAKPALLTVYSDPARATLVNLGRDGLVYADPYTGDSLPAASPRLRTFFQLAERLHRFLGAEDPSARAITSSITHIACAVFLGLTLTGLCLWWPRQWLARTLRPSLWFVRGASGKARDWNWHNVAGLWCSPLFLMLTLTGLLMGYKTLADALYKSPPPVAITRPEGARPLSPDALLALAQTTVPRWEQITLRLGNNRRPAPPSATPSPASASPDTAARPPAAPQPATVTIRELDSLSPVPRQLTIHPYTGAILLDERLSDYSLPRALRALAKPLHTGEAGGWLGATVGALASLAILLLVYTGLALSWRRFFPRRPAR